MKKSFRLTALLTTLGLSLTLFAGCGKDNNTTATTDGKSFTMWAVMDASTSASLKSYNEMLLFQELEKRTGVHIDFLHPIEGSTGSEAFMAMLSGNDRPDIIEYDWSTYSGGPQQAIDDEVIVRLNDYLKDHAPNYYDYLEGKKGKAKDYAYKLQSMTDEGSYYGFNYLAIGTTRCFSGLVVRGDKLSEWGMSVPETIDDWTAVLAKAKADGFKKPFTCINQGISFINPWQGFNTGFDVGQEFYVEDGKVVFAPFQPGYKEYIAQLAEWTKQGYIDTGYITNAHADVEGNLVNGISIAAYSWISTIGKLTPAAQEKTPGFELVACPYPSPEKGKLSRFQGVAAEASSVAYGISSTCGNIEKAIEWCDYIYSDEGNVLHTFGVEGDTYTVEEIDGETHYVYTDKIQNPESSGVTNIQQALYKYMLPANHPGLNQHPDYLAGYYPLEIQREAMALWDKGVELARPYVLPSLSFTEEEATQQTDILEIAEAPLEVAMADIILGKKSIDTWESAVKIAKTNGYDKLIEIKQAAYDRYLAKKNK